MTGNELFQVLFWFRFGEACKDEAGAGRQALGLEILQSYILHAVQLWDGAHRFLQIDSINIICIVVFSELIEKQL